MKSRFAQQQSEGSSSYKSSQADDKQEEVTIQDKVFRFTNAIIKSNDDVPMKGDTFHKDSMDVD